MSGGIIEYPVGHKLGMRVPKGGSNCAKCEYVDGKKCKNKRFVRWNGSEVIPAPTAEYCCDLFETGDREKHSLAKFVKEK